MTEVGRQQRQAGLDIGAFAVPGDKAVNGKGVPCIMKARLLSSARRAVHFGVRAQPGEHAFKLPEGDGFAGVRSEEGGLSSGRHRQMSTLDGIRGQRVGERVANGHQARLEEFGIADGQDALAQIHIATAQPQAFTWAKSRPVQSQQQGSEGRLPSWEAAVLQNRRCIEKALQFIAGIDVGLERAAYTGPVRWKWTGREVSAAHEPGEEPAQRLVLALPPSRRRPVAATELAGRRGIPTKPITDSGVKPITQSGQADHLSERSDAGDRLPERSRGRDARRTPGRDHLAVERNTHEEGRDRPMTTAHKKHERSVRGRAGEHAARAIAADQRTVWVGPDPDAMHGAVAIGAIVAVPQIRAA